MEQVARIVKLPISEQVVHDVVRAVFLVHVLGDFLKDSAILGLIVILSWRHLFEL